MLEFMKAYTVNSTVRFYQGKNEISKTDFIEGETAQLSAINADGIKERVNFRFSAEAIEAIEAELKAERLKSATVFKV